MSCFSVSFIFCCFFSLYVSSVIRGFQCCYWLQYVPIASSALRNSDVLPLTYSSIGVFVGYTLQSALSCGYENHNTDRSWQKYVAFHKRCKDIRGKVYHHHTRTHKYVIHTHTHTSRHTHKQAHTHEKNTRIHKNVYTDAHTHNYRKYSFFQCFQVEHWQFFPVEDLLSLSIRDTWCSLPVQCAKKAN